MYTRAKIRIQSPEGRVTRDDIEAKLQQIKGEVDTTAEGAKSYALIAGIAGVVVLVALAYVHGRPLLQMVLRRGWRRGVVQGDPPQVDSRL